MTALADEPKGKEDPKPKIPLEILVTSTKSGLVVGDITPRGVGYRMGLVKGDVILGVNGKKVDSVDRLRELLRDDTATVVWKGEDGKYYRNTVRVFFKLDPGVPPEFRFSDFEQGKSLKEFEDKDSKSKP